MLDFSILDGDGGANRLRNLLIALGICLWPILAVAQRPRAGGQQLVFTHVTVISATGAPAQPDMTVVLAGTRIAAIGTSKSVSIPKRARVVDAKGKFLIPGLWDMHAHIGGEDGDDDNKEKAYLSLWLANGVTGIRIMDGLPGHHRWRMEMEEGSFLAPRMVIASRIIGGEMSAAEARQLVRKAKQEGADFVKVHDGIPRDAYFALVDEARKSGLAVEGHVPESITAAEASVAGQKSIEHLTGVAKAAPDDKQAQALFALFRINGTGQCPTLVMRHSYTVLDDPGLANDPRLKYVEPSRRKSWLDMQSETKSFPPDELPDRRETVRNETRLVGEMQRAGVEILAGTDAVSSAAYVLPGFSLHEELAMLVQAGLTPMEALQAATRNPAGFLNALDNRGTVDAGKLADLVLLDADPLQDIANTRRINAIVINGHLIDRKALDQMLAGVETVMSR
jgi:imidazolonepropionase-like amidohydrolase